MSIDTTTYDFDGNIVSLKENSTATNYNYYLGSNQLHTTSGGTSASFTYDANGNSQQAGTSSLTYFPFSNLTGQVTKGSTTVNFSYNSNFQRIRKQMNSGTELTYYHGLNDYPLLEITSTSGSSPTALAYLYGPTGLVAIQQQASGSTDNYFVLKDHLGSIRVVTDSVRNVVAWFNYGPFGQLINSSDSGTVPVRYRYTGQEYDSETGLYNYRARLYNADLGRFYAPDPLQQQTSAYAYAMNNPILYSDPTGMFSWKKLGMRVVAATEIVVGIGLEVLGGVADATGVGAAAGVALNIGGAALIGAGINTEIDIVSSGISGDDISWGQFGIDQGVGAVTGVVGLATGGLGAAAMESVTSTGGKIAVGAVVGAADGAFFSGTSQVVENVYQGESWDSGLGMAMASGALIGGITGGIGGAYSAKCGCFTEDTPIKTAEGYKDIEEIQVGDSVWAYNVVTGENSLKKVTQLFHRTRKGTYKLYIGDEIVETTSEHPFYVNTTWVRADHLQAGDSLQLFSSNKAVVDSIVFTPGPARVYNFEVDELSNYYVSSKEVLVHNCFGRLYRYFFGTEEEEVFRNVMPENLEYELSQIGDGGRGPFKEGTEEFERMVTSGDTFKWVYSRDKELYVLDPDLKHSVAVRGKPVITAGQGQIKSSILILNNDTGHYRATFESLDRSFKSWNDRVWDFGVKGIEPRSFKNMPLPIF